MLTRLHFVVLTLAFAPDAATGNSWSDQQPPPAEEQHWAIKLGSRVHAADELFPLIDRVVLVPDAATYLDEIANWSPQGRWPVLIEDRHFAPMFIRRFAPAEVIRREPIELGGDPLPFHPNEIIARAWGGKPPKHSPEMAFDLHQHEPAGLIVSNAGDPAWLAGVALAAGRGQPIVHVNEDFGSPDSVISRERAAKIEEQIRHSLSVYGWPYNALGDTIETVTICATIAGKVNLPRHDTGEMEPAAMTDFLGRNDDGSRYAFVGWIFGDEIRSAYIAMCSLFLPRNSFTFVDGYPDDGPWQNWNVDPAAGLLAQRGFEVSVHSGNRASEDAWLRMIQSGLATDVLAVNTKGNVDFFDLTGDARMTAFDTPLLDQPAVVHFTHSWSMRLPATETSIAARFLDAGAYGYVGSVHEPLLAAFVPPLPLAQRWGSSVPMLIAARHWEAPQPFGGPWKVNTFGDPLMLAAPAASGSKPRIESKAEYGTRLNDVVRETMRQVNSDESGESIAESITLLELLGRDEIAVQLWRLAQQRGLASRAAGPALGPLFRKGTLEEFLDAWKEAGMAGNARALDMLWHKVAPEISRLRDEDVLLMLQGAIRRPHVQGDLSRLAPALSRVFGADHVRGVIEREIERADHRRTKRALQQLKRRY